MVASSKRIRSVWMVRQGLYLNLRESNGALEISLLGFHYTADAFGVETRMVKEVAGQGALSTETLEEVGEQFY